MGTDKQNDLKRPSAENKQPPSDDIESKAKIDFYKMEYEKGVQRHDDIYKSLWTNFSYMAVLAGGILTFGGDRLTPYLSGFLACVPLIFWYLATYLPLNAYGDQDARRLKEIEQIINADYFDIEPSTEQKKPRRGLHNFSDFCDRRMQKPKPVMRVRWVIHVFAAAVIVLAAYLAYMFVQEVVIKNEPVFYRKPADIKVDPADFKKFVESQPTPTPVITSPTSNGSQNENSKSANPADGAKTDSVNSNVAPSR